MRNKIKIGEVFTRLTVINDTGKKNKSNHRILLCECECGNYYEISTGNLRSTRIKSCGCLRKENSSKRAKNRKGKLHPAYKHGKNCKNSKTYRSWFNMKQRCINPNTFYFKNYGGRGIMICERWMVFENFLADMGECPKGMSIDRINNDGHYEPSNCKWSTRKEQARNSKQAKLNKDEVEKIRILLTTTNLLQRQIAKMFNVKQATISQIKREKIWL